MAMNKLLKIGILFIAILGTVIAPSSSFAQTTESINYVHQAKYKADSLYNAAAAFHASFVQPIDDIIAADPLLKQQLDNYINDKPINQEKEKEVIEIAKLRYDAVEMWYDIREELDNLLIDMCRYCLSQPCDTVGNYNWLRTQIEPMLDSVFHKSYTKCIVEYRVLLDNYELYTKEIGEFLKRNYKYTKIDGGLTEKQRTSIMNDFNGLKYMKYYNQRNKPPKEKPVYSPHLNNILQEFQRMVDSGFKNSKDRYLRLGQDLRNIHSYSSGNAEEKAVGQPGVSGLDGYTLEHFPTASCPGPGTVKIRVTVSPTGSVTRASVIGGTLSSNTRARNICLGLARQSRFRIPKGQTEERTGTLIYTIK